MSSPPKRQDGLKRVPIKRVGNVIEGGCGVPGPLHYLANVPPPSITFSGVGRAARERLPISSDAFRGREDQGISRIREHGSGMIADRGPGELGRGVACEREM